MRCSALTSLIDAGSVANGPSMTVTDSPTSKSTSMTFDAAAAAASTPSAAAPRDAAGFLASVRGIRNCSTSLSESGDGLLVIPTKPVTPGVLRTAPHDSSLSSMRTRM